MQEKIILLGAGNSSFSVRMQRGLYLLLAFLFSMQGGLSLVRDRDSFLSTSLGFLLVAGGIFYFYMAVMAGSKTARLSPKVRLTDEFIEFRLGFFMASVIIQWEDVRAITLKSYRLEFELKESRKEIKYSGTAELSLEVKEAVRGFALRKGIEVHGG